MDENVSDKMRSGSTDRMSPVADSRPAILVVDDDKRNLFALERALEDIATVVSADSGEEALRQILKHDVAVILLDVIMPGMDGYETAGLIRTRERSRQIPIIFLSAVNKDDAHMFKGYSMGAVDFVFKPVDTLILRSKVSVFVDLFAKNQEIQRKAFEQQRLMEENFRVRTEKIMAEQALRRSEERQAAVLGLLPIALYANEFAERMDRNLRGPRFFNETISFLTGYSRDHFESDPDLWLQRVHPEDRDEIVRKFADLVANETIECEYRWLRADGEYRYFLDQAAIIRDSNGSPVEIVGSLTDITERRQLEHQLVQSQKLDALGRFSGGIAHDFNNMLTVVMTCLNLLQRNLKEDPVAMRRVEMSLQGAQRCADLTRRLLMFARRQTLRAEIIDLNQLVASITDMIPRIIGEDIKLVIDCEPGQLPVKVDRTQAESALLNLVINSRDAMPAGGTLTISTGRDERHATDQPDRGTGADRYIALRVTDTGVGIPKEIVHRVFEPFFTTKEPGKGTGLGLSIIYGFVKESGGTIKLDSEIDRGTSIVLQLPEQADAITESAAEPIEHIAPGAPGHGETILVVEDDEGVRQAAISILGELGYRTIEAKDGHMALDLFDRTPGINLVFTDLVMPGMSGRELAEALSTRVSEPKVLLTSAYTDRMSTDAVPRCVIGFLQKPYNEEDLVRAVRRAIDDTTSQLKAS